MSRLVASRSPSPPPPSSPSPSLSPSSPPPPPAGGVTDYLERVAKYVPVEIIAAFLAIRAYVASQGALPAALEVVLYAALVVLTPIYLAKLGGNVGSKGLQIALATVSFVLWSYAIGGPFFWGALAKLCGVTEAELVYPGFAGALAVVWSLAAAKVRPAEPAAPPP